MTGAKHGMRTAIDEKPNKWSYDQIGDGRACREHAEAWHAPPFFSRCRRRTAATRANSKQAK